MKFEDNTNYMGTNEKLRSAIYKNRQLDKLLRHRIYAQTDS